MNLSVYVFLLTQVLACGATFEGTCPAINKGRCERRYPQIIHDIKDVLSPAKDVERMKDFLDMMNIFLDKCGACMTKNRRSTICEYAHFLAETLTDEIGLNPDYFNKGFCNQDDIEERAGADLQNEPPSITTIPTASPSSVTPPPAVLKTAVLENVALGKPTTQSSTIHGGDSSKAVDGNTSGHFKDKSITLTDKVQPNSWWQVNLLGKFEVSKIIIYNRVDCCSERLAGFKVGVWDKEHMVWSYHDPTPLEKPHDKITISLPRNTIASKVRVSIPGRNTNLSLAEVQVMGVPALESTPQNIALGKPTSQSSTGFGGMSSRAVDGNRSGHVDSESIAQTMNTDTIQWWEVNLEERYDIVQIRIYSRVDCCSERLNGFKVSIFDGEDAVWNYKLPNGVEAPYENIIAIPKKLWGSRVRISIPRKEYLSLAEVEVYYNDSQGAGFESVIDEKMCPSATQKRCLERLPDIVSDISSLASPPHEFHEIKDFMGTISAYLDQCGMCISTTKLKSICHQADVAAQLLADNLSLEKDLFDEESCSHLFEDKPLDRTVAQTAVNKSACRKRVTEIIYDISDITSLPIDHAELQDHADELTDFFKDCRDNIMPSHIGMICDAADDVAEMIADTVGLDTDYYDEEACNKGTDIKSAKFDYEAVFNNHIANQCMKKCDDLFSVKEYINDKNASKRNAACFVKCLTEENVEDVDVAVDLLPDPEERSNDAQIMNRAICKSTAKKVLSACLDKSYSWTRKVCYANHTAEKAACLLPHLTQK